jgi:hypothetical protein
VELFEGDCLEVDDDRGFGFVLSFSINTLSANKEWKEWYRPTRRPRATVAPVIYKKYHFKVIQVHNNDARVS